MLLDACAAEVSDRVILRSGDRVICKAKDARVRLIDKS
jgi:hypothetical protein